LGQIRGMSSARTNLIRLATDLASHQGVTHWAISMRLFGKGDFFKRLHDGGHPRSDTYEKALGHFSEFWPTDLEWPADIPRPASNPSKKESA